MYVKVNHWETRAQASNSSVIWNTSKQKHVVVLFWFQTSTGLISTATSSEAASTTTLLQNIQKSISSVSEIIWIQTNTPNITWRCKQEVDGLLCSWLLSNRNSSEGGTVMVKSRSRDDEVELLPTGSVRNRKWYCQEVLATLCELLEVESCDWQEPIRKRTSASSSFTKVCFKLKWDQQHFQSLIQRSCGHQV